MNGEGSKIIGRKNNMKAAFALKFPLHLKFHFSVKSRGAAAAKEKGKGEGRQRYGVRFALWFQHLPSISASSIIPTFYPIKAATSSAPQGLDATIEGKGKGEGEARQSKT